MRTVNIDGHNLEVHTFDDKTQPNQDVLRLGNLGRFNEVATNTDIKLARICEVSSTRIKTWEVSPWLVAAFEDHKHWNRKATVSSFLNSVQKNAKAWALAKDLFVIRLLSDKPAEKIDGVRGKSSAGIYYDDLGLFEEK